MSDILTTERLDLRKFTIDDTKFVIELVNSPGWLKFIGDRSIRTEDQANNYLLNGPIKSYQENGFGLYLVVIKDELKPIGMCGIIKRNGLQHPDIGFAFLPQFTGMGYAFEAASAMMVFARDQLKLATIFAITDPDNLASIKLLEKIGLIFNKAFSLQKDSKELLLYSSTIE